MKIDEKLAQTEAIILNSHLFRSKPQMTRLLRYLIKHSYSNDSRALQQRSIAVDCLGREEGFDSAKDPIVRIEAARLRKLLDSFYEQDNFTPPPYRISLPKGSYRLSFSRSLENKLSIGFSLLLVCQSPRFASDQALRLMLRIRRDLSLKLSNFRHIELTVDFSAEGQVAERGAIHFLAEEKHDYVLRMEVVENIASGDYLLSTIAVHRESQEILWGQSSGLAQEYTGAALESFYRCLISPLVADAYGLLGKHWAKKQLANGVEYIPDHHATYVHYIALCNEPTFAMARQFLDFLEGRLERYPADYVAKAGYLSLGFFDYFLSYKLIQDDYETRLQHALDITKYFPEDSGGFVLTGFCYFLLNDYEKSKVYLEAGRQQSRDNSMWDFIYGCLLFFMGERESGIKVLQATKAHNPTLPGYYHIPEFFYYLEREEPKAAYMVGAKVFNADNLEYFVKAMALQGVGASRLAKQEIAKLEAQDKERFMWFRNKVLRKYPTLQHKVSALLRDLGES